MEQRYYRRTCCMEQRYTIAESATSSNHIAETVAWNSDTIAETAAWTSDTIAENAAWNSDNIADNVLSSKQTRKTSDHQHYDPYCTRTHSRGVPSLVCRHAKHQNTLPLRATHSGRAACSMAKTQVTCLLYFLARSSLLAPPRFIHFSA